MSRYSRNSAFDSLMRAASDVRTNAMDLDAIVDAALGDRARSEKLIRAVALNIATPIKTIAKIGKVYPGLALCSPFLAEVWKTRRVQGMTTGEIYSFVMGLASSFLAGLARQVDIGWSALRSRGKTQSVPTEVKEILDRFGWDLPGSGIFEDCVKTPNDFERESIGVSYAMDYIVTMERFLDIMGEGFDYPAEAADFLSNEFVFDPLQIYLEDTMSYRSLGFLDVDAEARELASYAGQLMEEEMKARMPGIIASLQPNLNAAATKAVKASLQDAAIKEAIAGTQEKVATYALIGGLGIVLATSVLTWYLVKD